MSQKIILICEKCLSRNYSFFKNLETKFTRLEIKKFCPQCNKHQMHKESH